MAFKTRRNRSAAVGRGTMITALVLWAFALTQMTFGAVALTAGAVTSWAADGVLTGEEYRDAVRTASRLVELAIIMSLLSFMVALAAFVGPQPHIKGRIVGGEASRVRSLAVAGVESVTGRWFVVATAISVAMLIALAQPSSVNQLIICAALFAAYLALWIVVLRGIRRIAASDNSSAYFEGMSETEKKMADTPLPAFDPPGFVRLDQLKSAADATRYAHRAEDLARMFDWIGRSIGVLAAAVLGWLVSTWFSEPVSWSSIGVLAALASVLVGFGLERWARAYGRLQEQYEDVSLELAARVDAEMVPKRGGLRRRLRSLFLGARRLTVQASAESATTSTGVSGINARRSSGSSA